MHEIDYYREHTYSTNTLKLQKNVYNHNTLSKIAHPSLEYWYLYIYASWCEWLCSVFSKKKKKLYFSVKSHVYRITSKRLTVIWYRKNVVATICKMSPMPKGKHVYNDSNSKRKVCIKMLPVKTENFILKEYLLSNASSSE